jgi:hypothetical protein
MSASCSLVGRQRPDKKAHARRRPPALNIMRWSMLKIKQEPERKAEMNAHSLT